MFDAPIAVVTCPGERAGTTILRFSGPLTLQNLFSCQGYLRSLTPPCLIVDMSEVHYMDSAGLGLVMNGFVSAERGGRAFLLAGVRPRVQTLLELTRLHTVLKLFPTVREAENACPAT